MGDVVRIFTFDDVLSMSMQACIEAWSRVLAPEHPLLACMADVQVRLILNGVGISHEVLTELLMEYVTRLPCAAEGELRSPPQMTASFKRVWALLGQKKKERGLTQIYASHFLEAYARSGLDPQVEENPQLECVIPGLLARHHSKIALAVYNELPVA